MAAVLDNEGVGELFSGGLICLFIFPLVLEQHLYRCLLNTISTTDINVLHHNSIKDMKPMAEVMDMAGKLKY